MAVFKRTEPVRPEIPQRRDVPVSPQKMTMIGKTVVIKGKLRAAEEVVVEGKVEGSINVNHRVIIGKSGIVKADIQASEIVIHGRVDGNVSADKKVEIVPEGILNGNIIAQKVVLAEGAVFKGNIDMSAKEEKKPEPAPPAPVPDPKAKKEDVKK